MRRVRSVIGLIIIKEGAAEHGAELSLWKTNRVGKGRGELTFNPPGLSRGLKVRH